VKNKPTVERYRWKVVEAIPVRKLQDTLNDYSEKGWSLYALLRSRMGDAVNCVFFRLEYIGKRDLVDALVEDNPDPPFQGAQNVDD